MCYLNDDSLGKIAADLNRRAPSPLMSKSKRNREAYLTRKYTGRAPLQKAVSTGTTPNKNDGSTDRYLYASSKEASMFDEMFRAVQQEKLLRAKNPENMVAIKLIFW